MLLLFWLITREMAWKITLKNHGHCPFAPISTWLVARSFIVVSLVSIILMYNYHAGDTSITGIASLHSGE